MSFNFFQNSDPVGLVASSTVIDEGASATTVQAPGLTQNYQFAYWSLNGTIQRDLLGRAVNPVSFIMLETTTATAHYLPAGEDANTNAIPDWWELNFHTNLLVETVGDTDADGFDEKEEYRRDYHPSLKDEICEGGISMSLAGASLVIFDTNLASVAVSSTPYGVYPESCFVTNKNMLITQVDAFGLTNGYRFAYWIVNGVIQTDLLGRAYGGLSVNLQSNTEARAVFVLQADDLNTNTIPDWVELNFCGGLTESVTNDADGDGFDFLEEYRRDYHPNLKDEIREGGVSSTFAAPAFAIINTNLASYSVGSTPSGLISPANLITNKGTLLLAPDSFGVINGYRFAYWAANGIIQTDLLGRALGTLSFALASNTAVEAVFMLEGADVNTNAIPDWFEFNFCGGLMASVTNDADGDGFDFLEEYRRDTHPGLKDDIQEGGVSVSYGSPSLAILDTNLASVVVGSTPFGLYPASTLVTNKSAVLATRDVFGETNGYRFAYWTVNGMIQTDLLGRAYGILTLAPRSNSVVEAVFLPVADDVNSNGIPDWYEFNLCGGLSGTTGGDPDGDGFDLLEEYRRDTHPNLKDEIREGGITLGFAQSTEVTFNSFQRVGKSLADGIMCDFFSLQPPGTGTFAMAGGSCPALGDWDGDGDLDLFVGGQGGQIRVYENAGSPVVQNFVNRTANFTVLASLWTGIHHPAPALGDWNGDGSADLAVGGDTGVVLLVSSTTNFLAPQQPAITNTLETGLTSAIPAFVDVNADGLLDLLVLTPAGTVNAYTNTGSGGCPFSAGSVISNLLGFAVPDATGIAAADFNEDGNPDILISDVGGNIWEFDGDGAGHFSVKNKVFAGSYRGFATRLTLAAGDLEGDGDPDLLGGYAEGGLVYLRNPAAKLVVSPPSVTLLTGQSATFHVPGNTNITWSLLKTPSAGTLDASSGVYTAGAAGGCIDVIQGRNPEGLKGLAYANVITAADMARAGKAIVIAGRRSTDDPLWPTTDYLSQLGYNTLLYRGFDRGAVRYLSPEPNRDMDGNGQLDDIAGETTYANVAQVFTNWVQSPGDVFIYLVDHGGDSSGAGYFRLNAAEVLTASNLDLWLDQMQDRYSNAVTVVIDCCYAGSFLDELAYQGAARRTVIAACGTNEPTYFVSGGLISFSDAFFSGVMLGLDLADSFTFARSSVQVYQGAMLDDNGDGLFVEGVDGSVSRGISVGVALVAGRDIPQLGSVCGSQTLIGGASAELWVGDVVSVNPIQRVWCLVVPPGYDPDPADPVADVPAIELPFNASSGRYQGTYSGFNQKGSYKIQFYAQDIWGSIALPRQSYVAQNGFDERMVLVAGGATNEARWPAVNSLCRLAWHTARKRWLTPQAVTCLNGGTGQDFDSDGTNDVSAPPSLAGLANAITNWAADSDKLTVCLIGDGTNGTFRVSETEALTPQMLGAWLDGYQVSNREVSVIMDFPGSGAFLPLIKPAEGRTRIGIASAKPGQNSIMSNDGRVSFSQYFFSDVFSGYSIGRAFLRAKNAIRSVTGRLRQYPQLDDNGDGLSSWTDGTVALQRYIGSAFITGDDAPVVGRVMPAMQVETNVLTLWAADVTAMSGISNVWCLITPPDYMGEENLQQMNLAWNAGNNRYEADYDGFAIGGTYVLSFYAQNAEGEISSPVQTTVLTVDAYEPDNTNRMAAPINLEEIQGHNFHAPDDEDWVRFYAAPGPGHDVYEVMVDQQGSNSNVRMELFYEYPDGTLMDVDWVDDGPPGPGESKTVSINFETWPDLPGGFYCVRVTPLDPAAWGLGSEYDISVSVPMGGGGLLVVVVDKLNGSHSPPGATVVVDGGAPQALNGSNSVALSLSSGTHTITVPAIAGYVIEESPLLAGQVGNPLSYYGNPKNTVVADNAWQSVVFQFVPMGRVDGVLRDRVTGAWAAGAKLEFRARSGAISNLVYDGFPNNATYESQWQSGPDGVFPTNVWLPTVDWDLAVMAAGYSNGLVPGAIRNLQQGTVTNLGTIWLAPLDTNRNDVADSWEQQYFPGQLVVLTNDADHDGMDNGSEYRCGTNPTDSNSVLRLDGDAMEVTNGFSLTWPVVPGRDYRLLSTDSLRGGSWPQAQGPWTATATQSVMHWDDLNTVTATSRFYRIEVIQPR